MPAMAAEAPKVVLHLNNQHKLHILESNILNLRKSFGDKVDIVVVVNGPAVIQFAKFAKTENRIRGMLDQQAEISVCSNAMRNNDLLRQQLLDGIIYLDQGGVARLVELQQQGYSYIKI
jgi:intracellular sulfur oxidation DsrE/DsrF family protein